MSDAPERIWCNPEGHWLSVDDSEARYHPSTEYVRADLYDALAKERDELRAEVERLRRVLSMCRGDSAAISRAALQRKKESE